MKIELDEIGISKAKGCPNKKTASLKEARHG
jgi:hypothetical protein